MNDYLLNPRADILIESMRSIGYTFESAMADIIDNSISAEAKNIDIKFSPINCDLACIDDGYGMDLKELKEAMRWGSKDPLNKRSNIDLGRFGLGLKSASLSQCRKLTVISKKDNRVNGLVWDLDYVRETGNWLVKNVDDYNDLPFINDLLSNHTGTYVLWSTFDRIEASSKNIVEALEDILDYSADYLELIFHMFISKGLNITINNVKLNKIDPFLRKNSCTQALKEEQLPIKDNDGNTHFIKIEPYVLPHFNSLSKEEKNLLSKHNGFRNKQGFYIYRNNRLIIWGTWFRMVGANELFKNARVKVDIPNSLDDIWSIDVKKSTASIPSSIKKQLYYFVKESIGTSKRVYTKRSVNKNKELGYKCVWDIFEEDNKTVYKINRELPILEQLCENLNDEQLNLLNIALEDIENNIPKYEIYNQISSNNDSVNESNYDDVKNRVIELFKIYKPTTRDSFDAILKNLMNSEPYCKYPNLYEDILKEIKLYD